MNEEFDKAVRCAISAREHRRIARLFKKPLPFTPSRNHAAIHEAQARRYERVVRRIADKALKESVT